MIQKENAGRPIFAKFNATISATGWFNDDENLNRLVHLISVSPSSTDRNCWTVLRDHSDFTAFQISLQPTGAPPFPNSPTIKTGLSSRNTSPQELATSTRNLLQDWLDFLLKDAYSADNPLIQQFLCFGANLFSTQQLEGVNWVTFAPPSRTAQDNATSNTIAQHRHSSLDEMEMDDMFDTSGPNDDEESSADEDDGGSYEYFAVARYQPVQEAVTQEDAMEIQLQASEAEMVEDVGSLAQSLGASHLGRSLQRQAELKNYTRIDTSPTSSQNNPAGVVLGGKTASNKICIGIGDALSKTTKIQSPTPLASSAPRLDSFKIIKVIGKGSFGKVFLVKEIKTDEMYALKVLRKDNIIKRNQVEHTRTERSVLGYVKHPFIVGLNMAFQSKDKLYFVLDYCAGGELFFHLGKLGKFPEPRACFYTAEIILALSYVHELDIIYRDLKPENVLLDARGHIKLTDFGLSKEGISSSSSGAYSFCGTPEYLAPEILNRHGHGRAVDWWSLGALLYEMLTGLPPFYCRDREKLFEKIRKSELTYPRYLSACCITLLRGLLTRDPRRRLGSGPKDSKEIKCHVFFQDIDWNKLSKGEIPPPWDPQLINSLDTSQFDMEFTSMPIFSPGSFQPRGGFGNTPQENVFEGFTFTDRAFYHP